MLSLRVVARLSQIPASRIHSTLAHVGVILKRGLDFICVYQNRRRAFAALHFQVVLEPQRSDSARCGVATIEIGVAHSKRQDPTLPRFTERVARI